MRTAEEMKIYKKEYNKKNREQIREATRQYRDNNREKFKEWQRAYKKRHPDRIKKVTRLQAIRRGIKDFEIKKTIVSQYGGKCNCCGEQEIKFLSIDHINNDGAEHRKVIGRGKLYSWLIKNNFPKDNFQLLCFNCNVTKGFYGICPHQITR